MGRARSPVVYILLVISTFWVAVQAIEPVPEYEGIQIPLGQDGRPPNVVDIDSLIANEEERAERQRSSEFVEEALSILRSIRPPSAPKRKEQPSFYINKSLYYLQKLLDFLFVANVPSQEEPLDGETRSSPRQISPELGQAAHLLQRAAASKNPDAMFLLAELNFYGNYSYPRNSATAFGFYKELASLTGNSTAQNMVAFMYSTGYGGFVAKDQAKALLYHTFAALGGNTRSEMTLAFRYHAGISTPRNCEEAAFYYKRVADKAIEYYLSGPPGGMHLPRNSFRIADEDGGVYGEGASYSSAGPNRKRIADHSSTTSMDDILEYLMLLSNKGELSATYQLAKLYYEGPRGMTRDLKKAREMFFLLAKKMWTKDGKETKDPSDLTIDAGSKAAGYLGRMYLRGEAVPQDLAIARRWFSRGLKYADVISQHGMGYLYENGLAGVDKNLEKAQKLYKAAAEEDYGAAQVSLGRLFYNRGEYAVANKWFELATRHGNVEAYYRLAEINNHGHGRERSCGMATLYYKHVAERVEALQSPLEWAHRAYKNNQRESAIVGFMMGAEQGYESAQANVAWIMDEQKSKFPLDWWRSRRNDALEQELSLMYWTRSAKQQNIDSFVKMGDYYLGGIGTEPDTEKAASCYVAASEFQQSAQALWNLGWMHENGIGVEQDYHLAKRYYDQAVESNGEAAFPVFLSLLRLRVRSFWNTISGGTINAIGSDPEPKKVVTFREWMKKWFSDEKPKYTHNQPGDDADDAGGDHRDSDKSHEQRNDYYNLDEGELEDDILENFLILGVMVVIGILFIIRNQRAQQRQERERQQQQQNGQPQQGGVGGPNNAGPWQNGDPRNNPWGIPPPPGF